MDSVDSLDLPQPESDFGVEELPQVVVELPVAVGFEVEVPQLDVVADEFPHPVEVVVEVEGAPQLPEEFEFEVGVPQEFPVSGAFCAVGLVDFEVSKLEFQDETEETPGKRLSVLILRSVL